MNIISHTAHFILILFPLFIILLTWLFDHRSHHKKKVAFLSRKALGYTFLLFFLILHSTPIHLFTLHHHNLQTTSLNDHPCCAPQASLPTLTITFMPEIIPILTFPLLAPEIYQTVVFHNVRIRSPPPLI